MSIKVDQTGPRLVTQADYARHRAAKGLPGCTREAVRKAVEAGRISTMGADKLIDPAVADIQWAQNSRGRMASVRPGGAAPQAVSSAPVGQETGAQGLGGGVGAGPGPGQAGGALPGPAGGLAGDVATGQEALPIDAAAAAAAAGKQTYQDARTRREVADAISAEIDAQKKAGKLVDRELVERAVHDAFHTLRDRIMAMPRSCAPEVVGKPDVREVEVQMTKALREAFDGFEQQMQQTIQARMGTA